jgi:hypothetical protein
MTFTRLVKVKGRLYRVEVRSERVDGKVKQRFVRYLGPVLPRR